MSYVVQKDDPSPKCGGLYYWIGVTRVSGIGLASWTSDLKDATQYLTKREARRICEAHKRRHPRAADRYSVQRVVEFGR